MVPPIFPKPRNLSELANKFAPELDALNNVVSNSAQKGFEHLNKLTAAASKDEFKKAAAKEIVEIISTGPARTLETIDSISETLKSGAKKAVELMKESENPIVSKTAKKAEESDILNPEGIINTAAAVIKDTIQKADKIGRDLEQEVVKEVIKTKVKKGFFDNKFFNFFKNIFAKIKAFCKNLIKKDTKINN